MIPIKLTNFLIALDATPPPTGENGALWENLKNMLNSVSSGLQLIIPPIILIALAAVAIMYLSGFQDLVQRAPAMLRRVGLGALIGFGATAILGFLNQIVGFL